MNFSFRSCTCYLLHKRLTTIDFFICMDKHSSGFYCNFDRSQCDFVQRQDDNFNWIRKKGATSSGGTGPHSDVKGSGKAA